VGDFQQMACTSVSPQRNCSSGSHCLLDRSSACRPRPDFARNLPTSLARALHAGSPRNDAVTQVRRRRLHIGTGFM